jgi:hypothetical protein
MAENSKYFPDPRKTPSASSDIRKLSNGRVSVKLKSLPELAKVALSIKIGLCVEISFLCANS